MYYGMQSVGADIVPSTGAVQMGEYYTPHPSAVGEFYAYPALGQEEDLFDRLINNRLLWGLLLGGVAFTATHYMVKKGRAKELPIAVGVIVGIIAAS